MISLKKHLAEGMLIVFSVLFALLINKAFEYYQTQEKKAIALESIQKELQQNAATIEDWKERHQAIHQRIAQLVAGEQDSLKQAIQGQPYLNMGMLTANENFIDAVLTNTAWETARTTGIISEFDFETTRKLTFVYDMQEMLMNKTINSILNYYFDEKAHDMARLDQVLLQFQLRFGELTGQENLLDYMYEDVLQTLQDQ